MSVVGANKKCVRHEKDTSDEDLDGMGAMPSLPFIIGESKIIHKIADVKVDNLFIL